MRHDDGIGASIAIDPARHGRDGALTGRASHANPGFHRTRAAHSPWGLSTFLMSPRTPLSRSSAGEERGLVNSPDAMRSSRVLARHGVATRRRESLTPAAPLLLCNDSDPRPRIARPAPRLEREDADGVTREGAAVASDAYIVWKVAFSESQPPSPRLDVVFETGPALMAFSHAEHPDWLCARRFSHFLDSLDRAPYKNQRSARDREK